MGMSKYSIAVANFFRIKTVLYIGEESLDVATRKGIHQVNGRRLARLAAEQEAADLIICESQFVLNSLPAHIRHKTIPIGTLVQHAFIQNETDTVAIQRSNNKFKICVIQTYLKKNVGFIYNIVNNLNFNVTIDVFGDASYFKDRELPKNTTIHGTIPFAKLKSEILKCNAILFPTLSDGGPRALIESCLLGIPVIASPNCIAPDVIHIFPNLTVVDLEKDEWISALELLIDPPRQSPSITDASNKKYENWIGQNFDHLVYRLSI
jgi:hypothetical protein